MRRDRTCQEGTGREGKGQENGSCPTFKAARDDVPSANCQDRHKHDLGKGIWPHALISTTEALICWRPFLWRHGRAPNQTSANLIW